MTQTTLPYLLGLAATLGVVHTLSGPDHYIPFIAMARVGRWSLRKTVVVTLLCGIGHVLSSVLVGILGVFVARMTIDRVSWFEGQREQLAGWLLLGFGLAYMAWGVRRAVLSKRHAAHAAHGGADMGHVGGHDSHRAWHRGDLKAARMTPWILFTVFVFGPCEILIPVLMVPAATLGPGGIALVTLVFTVATLVTMSAVVIAAYIGLRRVSSMWLERYAHAAAGLALSLCGAAITVA